LSPDPRKIRQFPVVYRVVLNDQLGTVNDTADFVYVLLRQMNTMMSCDGDITIRRISTLFVIHPEIKVDELVTLHYRRIDNNGKDVIEARVHKASPLDVFTFRKTYENGKKALPITRVDENKTQLTFVEDEVSIRNWKWRKRKKTQDLKK